MHVSFLSACLFFSSFLHSKTIRIFLSLKILYLVVVLFSFHCGMTNQQTEQSILHWPLHGHDRNLSTYVSQFKRKTRFTLFVFSLSSDDKLKISDIILTDLLAASSHTNIPSLISRNTRKRKHPMNILASTNKRSNTTVMFFPQLNPSIPPLFVVSIENSKSIQTDLNFTLIQQDYDRDIERLKSEINELRKNKFDLQNQHDSTVEQIERCLNITRSLLIEQSQFERKQTRKKAMANRLRLGQFITQRQGMSFVEQWIDGVEFIDKQRAKEQLIRSKDNLDKERKNLSKTKAKQITRKTQSKCQRSSSSSSCCLVAEFNDSSTLTYKDWCEYDEVLRLRQLTYKREEYDLAQDCDRLDRERHLHIRELKRLYNEDQSRFNQNVVLNQRYLLLSLIGKGGFSEVHRAFDLNEQRYVACKIHQLNREWKEEKKANFIKHALREYDIHKHLEHKSNMEICPSKSIYFSCLGIVKLFDVFEIDMNSFCTVLEYCDGNDLDLFLKENKILPEKEARSIIMQLVNALKYLNKDVKPPVVS